MTLDALRLEVPDILEEDSDAMSNLAARLQEFRRHPLQEGLQEVLGTLFRLNRCALTLLERQRALQSLTEEYRHYSQLIRHEKASPALFVHFCTELAAGFKRLLLQILHGRKPSRPHMAWCLYMAQHFLAQALLSHYQQYQQPPGALWRDSHLLYWIGESQDCLDEPVAAAFDPIPAGTPRGLYQQILLLALSNPFHLTEGEAPQLFSALAPLAALGRLQAWDEEEQDGCLIDLGAELPCISQEQIGDTPPGQLRHLELGALLIALHDPAQGRPKHPAGARPPSLGGTPPSPTRAHGAGRHLPPGRRARCHPAAPAQPRRRELLRCRNTGRQPGRCTHPLQQPSRQAVPGRPTATDPEQQRHADPGHRALAAPQP